MIPYKQLSLADIFSDCHEKFENDKPAFLSLLETHIDIDELIPISFRNHFYASTGRTRKYPLQAFLWALIIQRIFSIPTDQLLLTFLAYSKPLKVQESANQNDHNGAENIRKSDLLENTSSCGCHNGNQQNRDEDS